ncbi:MAG TPA: hypothetical protein VFE21_08435 [Rubrobacteraceae bacterium]|nr:hypothetical protein [Rubrobacteraceae bacterium]
MARRSREAYLWDIADSCGAIVEFVRDRNLSEYEQNRISGGPSSESSP